MSNSPFNLHNDTAYQHWREAKLTSAPTDLNALIVEIGDPRQLTASEHAAILERCRLANMAIYVSTSGDDSSKEIPIVMGAHFGLHQLDHNAGADEDAITSLTVQTDAAHENYIPYSNRPIDWHTDGYYNAPKRQINGLLLHCVHPAADGGENALLDHEITYIQIRDHNPEFIHALMQPNCMTIPANEINGVIVRPAVSGPVFSIQTNGALHMCYTNRARNIIWHDDPLTTAAVTYLKILLRTDSPWHFLGKLQAGWGLISNNVLHTRTGFTDDAHPRLLYRARYYDRIVGC
ncbi:taurine catabolism dioxygenase TauD [Chromatium weissei]|nr:taurine catabolism dioxygenase TauD [Chromatium weissei]